VSQRETEEGRKQRQREREVEGSTEKTAEYRAT